MPSSLLRLALCLLAYVLAMPAHGQAVRPTRWLEFYSYTHGRRVLPTGRGVLLVCDQALLEYQPDGLLNRYSSVQGLAGARVADADYDPTGAALLVAYQDGTIDIAAPSERLTITALRDATPGSVPLPIGRVAIGPKAAYALTATHLLRIARRKGQRVESLRIWSSDKSHALTLHDVHHAAQTLYIGTSEGIYSATEQADGTLGLATPIPGAQGEAARICVSPCGRTIAAWVRGADGLSLMLYENGSWRAILQGVEGEPQNIATDETAFWACNGRKVWRVSHLGTASLLWDDDTLPTHAQLAPQGACSSQIGIGIASRRKGLVRLAASGGIEPLSPHSPPFASAYRLALTPAGPTFTAGGLSPEGSALSRAFGLYNPLHSIELEDARDAGAIVLVNPADNHYLVGTATHGLLEIAGDRIAARHDATNSPMQPAAGSQGSVVDVVVAPDGGWWVLMQHGGLPLLYRSPHGEWVALPLPPSLTPQLGRMRLSATGNLWFASPVTGRVGVINPSEYLATNGEKGFASQRVFLPNSGKEANPHDLAFDSSGHLWIATSRTLLTAAHPDDLLKQEELAYNAIVFPDPDWSDRAAHHLTEIQCTALMLDAGDGVWVGTSGGSVYHIDPVSKSLVKRYRPHETPLPGGRVHDLAFDAATGLVYVASEYGVVALLGESGSTAPNYSNVRIYPNPLRPNMPSEITIDGLKRGSTIKITDVAGDLVRELHSLGGRAVWDVKNGRGRTVSSGVYLLFISDEKGRETAVERVAIVR